MCQKCDEEIAKIINAADAGTTVEMVFADPITAQQTSEKYKLHLWPNIHLSVISSFIPENRA